MGLQTTEWLYMALENGFDGSTEWLCGFREWLRWVYRMALRMASMGVLNGF